MAEGSSSTAPDLESGSKERLSPRIQSPSISHPGYMYMYNRRENPILRSWSRSALKIVDINRDSTMTIVSDCHEEDYLSQALNLIPRQRASAIRVFNLGFPLEWRNKNTLILQRHFDKCMRMPLEEDVFNMRNLATQWRLRRSDSRCFGLRPDPLHEGHNIYIQCFRRFGKNIVIQSLSRAAFECKTVKVPLLYVTFTETFKQLEGIHVPTVKLIVLCFIWGAIKQNNEILDDMIYEYVHEEPWHIPGRANYATMKKFDIHNLRFQTIMNTAEDLILAAEFTISSITNFIESVTSSSSTSTLPLGLQHTFEDLQGACIQLKKTASRHLAYGDRIRDIYLSSLNIKSNQSITRLTVVAAVSLPLSLGAGILSMQTRFVDLHYLLYDFFGVGLLLASGLILAYFVVSFFVRISEHLPFAGQRGVFGKVDTRILVENSHNSEDAEIMAKKIAGKAILYSVPRYFFWGVFFVFTVITFVVGMVVQVEVGLLLLGHGSIGFFSVFVIVLSLNAWYSAAERRVRRHEEWLEQCRESDIDKGYSQRHL